MRKSRDGDFKSRVTSARFAAVAISVASLACGCGGADVSSDASTAPENLGAGAVTAERLVAADTEPGHWLAHGRTYGEQRFSPLDQIERPATSVELGLAWYDDTGTDRGARSDADRRRRRDVRHDRVERRARARRARPASCSGSYDPKVPRESGAARAATSSTAASRCGRARSTSARSTDA